MIARNGKREPLDFISSYASYADVLEAPRMLHEVVGIQLVATVLNRRGVKIPNGAVPHSLDLWTLLLSGSGAGRTTTVGMAAKVLDAADMADLTNGTRWGSAPALFQHFSDNPCGLEVWSEMGEKLKLLNQSGFETAKEWLTDRYDNFAIPAPIRYRVTGKSSDTPSIEFASAPRINILATSADAWFFNNLIESDSMGGFMPRWVLVRPESERLDIAVPLEPDPALVEPLTSKLRQIASLSGPADVSGIEDEYRDWYGDTKTRFLTQPNSALSYAYFNRHRSHALKMAVIFQASANGTLAVSHRAWRRAAEFMSRVEQTFFSLLPTGMSGSGFQLQRFEEKIKQAGRDGITQNDFTRAFQAVKLRDREEYITTLHQAGKIDIREALPSSPHGGRPKTTYVHEDYL